jgi:hypothetical protein
MIKRQKRLARLFTTLWLKTSFSPMETKAYKQLYRLNKSVRSVGRHCTFKSRIYI